MLAIILSLLGGAILLSPPGRMLIGLVLVFIAETPIGLLILAWLLGVFGR